MKRVIRIIGLLLAIGIAGYAIRYLGAEKTGVLLEKGVLADLNWYRLAFTTHVLFGMFALVGGALQFFPSIRNRYLRFHRLLGYFYFVSVAFSGIAGLILAYYSFGGWVTHIGFGLLGIGWLSSSALGFKAALNRNFMLHEAWLHRSYAFTLAAVTLRIWLPILTGLIGFSFLTSYQIVSWLCWVPNILLMEWYVCRYVSKNG